MITKIEKIKKRNNIRQQRREEVNNVKDL